ncbi:MAG: IS200/IS605 family transposase [Pyrinomonadaceae bacterium]|nr:IS200/IS605 family transposase [Pyrinomonadaceae bacterium]
MATTFSSLFYHFVFSTKHRKRFIHRDLEDRVWSYVGGIARKRESKAIQIGGIEDHLHALIMAPPKYSPSEIAQFLKGESSKWIHEEFSDLSLFRWQDGFSAFSVSKSIVPRVVEYIRNQRQHHEGVSFEDEYRELLRLHEVEIKDERYLMD